jgi:hypothetical protein
VRDAGSAQIESERRGGDVGGDGGFTQIIRYCLSSPARRAPPRNAGLAGAFIVVKLVIATWLPASGEGVVARPGGVGSGW